MEAHEVYNDRTEWMAQSIKTSVKVNLLVLLIGVVYTTEGHETDIK